MQTTYFRFVGRQAFPVVCLIGALSAASVQAGEKMVIVGGGSRPTAALSRFVTWAGDNKASILVLTWATDPGLSAQDHFDAIESEIGVFSPGAIHHGPTRSEVSTTRAKLVDQIKAATGIFFTGGDQNLIMDVLEDDRKAHPASPSLLDVLRDRYRSGVVFGGTSAGTAIMSSPMLNGVADLTVLDGTKVGTRPGFDFLPGAIVDQHFLAKGRLLRLMGLVQLEPKKVGLGIDECTALLIEDSRLAEVVGCSYVLAITTERAGGELKIDPLEAGAKYDLHTRTRM